MKYITGQQALNLPCSLDTCGDWHTSALRWDKLNIKDSEGSVFGDYGIEQGKEIPEHSNEFYNVANHIRAILDLLEAEQFALITNFNNDYICNNKYTEEIFEKVSMLLPNTAISNFMHKTYGKEWRLWCERAGIGSITAETVMVKDLPAIVDEEAIIGKINAYMHGDKLEDLCGVVHIINHHYDQLSQPVQMMLRNALEYKGAAYFDYVVSTQICKNVNIHQLAMDYIRAYEKMGLVMDKKEKQVLLEYGM